MIPFILAWDQAPHWGKKEKTISVREKKNLSGEGKGWWTFPYPQTTARLSSLADIFCISPLLPFFHCRAWPQATLICIFENKSQKGSVR